jgi:hypothetical protein
MKAATFISMVASASETATRHVQADKIIQAIKQGKWRTPVEQIRRLYAKTILRTGDREAAKKAAKLAVAPLKKKLPAILWSGRFKQRSNGALIQHSSLICADLDDLGSEALKAVRLKLLTSPSLWALFRSPTKGLKAIFRVSADPLKHLASFRAVEKHVRDLTGVQIDQSCKDLARLCFVSYDPDCYFNPDARKIEPLPEPEKPKALTNGVINLSERQRIATELLGNIEWVSETRGYVVCPGKHLHTTGDGERDCEIHLDGAPTIHCFHSSCAQIREELNRKLRSCIGKAESVNQPKPRHRGRTGQSPSTPSQWFSTRFPSLADKYGDAVLEKIDEKGIVSAGDIGEDFFAGTLGHDGSPDAPTIFLPTEEKFYTYAPSVGIFVHCREPVYRYYWRN